jgi:AhpD family alkylhydroperoxidase
MERAMMQRAAYQTLITEGLRALGGVHSYVAASGLEKPLLDLVYLRASQMNGCAYCIDAHSADARKGGAAPEKLALLSTWREGGPPFSARERAALAWTEALTLVADSHASDADYAAVSASLTDQEVATLTLAIGLINTYNRLAIGFRRPPESVVRAERATSSSPSTGAPVSVSAS